MSMSKDGGYKVHDEIKHLLGDGLAFFNEMERRAEDLARRRGADDMDGLLSRAEKAYREMILHVRKAHQAMNALAQTIHKLEESERSLPRNYFAGKPQFNDGLGR